MKRPLGNWTVLAIALAASISMPGFSPSNAADRDLARRDAPSVLVLPFPRSERAQSVWSSGACWSECGSYTAWNLAACLERDRQGRCVKRADSADRACQRECRTSGGPLLPIDF
ncbi:MAG TPA: hypothetical protein VFC54_07525 [Pseudolabrys sp.]|nr:hypothetical protein [Pseudolabrys sp.]